MISERARRNETLEKEIARKRDLRVAKNIRTTHRSRKPEVIAKNNEPVKIDPETELARRYLGIQVPDDWNNIGASGQQAASEKPNEEEKEARRF